MRIITISLGVALWFAAGSIHAERYLSIAEALEICFPKADQFESRTLRLTPEQSAAIARSAGVKVRSPDCRMWLARANTNLVGVLIADQVLGKHELIDYAVALSVEGKVQQVEILEYRENYGNEIRKAKWRDQFKGKASGARLRLNDDIYNISGATISCRNVTEGIRRVLATFEHVVRPWLLSGDRVPDAPVQP